MLEKTNCEKQNKRIKALEQPYASREQAEDYLRLFKKLVENATDAIGISTPEGHHWYQNAAFDALFGDIGVDPPTTVYCDEKVGREVFDTVMAGGEWSGEVQMYGADGRVLDILLRAYAFTDESGRIVGLVGMHTDITTNKRSQELFKLVAQSTNDIFYEWDVQDDSLRWFSDIATELGYAPGEVSPTINGWIELIHPDDRLQLANAVEKHRTSTHNINYLYRVKAKNGSWRYWRDHASPILDNQNLPLRWVGGISDITEQKRAEEALRQSETRFRELADMMPQIVFETDVSGNLTFVNRNAFTTFGYSESDFNSGLNAIQMITPMDRERATDEMRQRMSGQSNHLGSEYIAMKKDGTEFPVIIYSNMFCCDGNPAGLRGIIIDITERKHAEDERKNLQAQLLKAQKMESIGTLAGGIAHNFNNILMGVQGRTSLMMTEKDPTDPDYEHLKGIEEIVKNAVELTRDLLGFARGGKYEVKPIDLNILIERENQMFGRTKREIRVQGKYEDNLWNVEVDQSQIRQALLNIYVNAWQAMPSGGDLYIQTENVTLHEEHTKPFAVTPGRYVKVSVSDTGLGMEPETLEKIFDPFFTTKDFSQGSGLGLASVYGIIKNHGGFIDVDSEKGEGTTFKIYLPASEKQVVKEDPGPRQHRIHHGQGKILLVDDEKMFSNVGKAMLKKLGYRVLIAGSGREGIDLYEKQRDEIDLVILDMIMPGMGGGETFDRIKKINGNVPIMLSSGYSIDGQAKEIMDRGCSSFIQKPFTLEELSWKVREALVQRKSEGQQ